MRAVTCQGRRVTVLGVLGVLAMSGQAGAPMARLVHTGAGVARREAHHERRTQERANLEEHVDVEASLRMERSSSVIVRVAAGSIVVAAEGPNYVPKVKRETKKQRRARQQQAARDQQEAAAREAEQSPGDAASTDAGADGEATTHVAENEAGDDGTPVNGRLSNALCD